MIHLKLGQTYVQHPGLERECVKGPFDAWIRDDGRRRWQRSHDIQASFENDAQPQPEDGIASGTCKINHPYVDNRLSPVGIIGGAP
jgi:hypothetical protein